MSNQKNYNNSTTFQKVNQNYDTARIAYNKWEITLEELIIYFTKCKK